MTPFPSGCREIGWPAIRLQFIDEAHARLYDLGASARAGITPNPVAARALRDRMLPFMDLSDAKRGSALVSGMGGRERAEFRQRGLIGLPRFVAWAVEYAQYVDDEASTRVGEVEAWSLYDPDLLLDLLMFLTRSRGVARRVARPPP